MLSTRYRFMIAVMLSLAGTINYMDRAALGVVAPMVSKEFEISPSTMGIIFGTFAFGYAIFAFIGGQLADRFGPHRIFSWAAFMWSLFCGLTGVVTGAAQLFIVRTLFGCAEGPMLATNSRLITNWFPRQETSRAVAVIWSGQSLGAVIAGPVVGLLSINYGWRFAFIVIGLIGLAWVLAWYLLASDRPQGNSRVSPAEVAHIEANRIATESGDTGERSSFIAQLGRPSVLTIAFTLFSINYALYFFLTWLPSYITDALHVDIAHMVFLTAAPWACGFIGYLVGGFGFDYLYQRMSNKLLARKISIVLPLAIAAAALIMVLYTTTAAGAVSLIAVSAAMLVCSGGSCWATIREVVPEKQMGGVSGYIHMISNIPGIIGPPITGFAIQFFGNYTSAFAIAAALSIAAILAVIVLVKWPTHSAFAPQVA